MAACSLPQLVDRARLIKQRFSEGSMFVANTPRDYYATFEYMLANPAEENLAALRALEDVFDRHTTFHRAETFIRSLLEAELLRD